MNKILVLKVNQILGVNSVDYFQVFFLVMHAKLEKITYLSYKTDISHVTLIISVKCAIMWYF